MPSLPDRGNARQRTGSRTHRRAHGVDRHSAQANVVSALTLPEGVLAARAITGPALDEPVPDHLKRLPGRSRQPHMIDMPRPHIGVCRSASVFPSITKTLS